MAAAYPSHEGKHKVLTLENAVGANEICSWGEVRKEEYKHNRKGLVVQAENELLMKYKLVR